MSEKINNNAEQENLLGMTPESAVHLSDAELEKLAIDSEVIERVVEIGKLTNGRIYVESKDPMTVRYLDGKETAFNIWGMDVSNDYGTRVESMGTYLREGEKLIEVQPPFED